MVFRFFFLLFSFVFFSEVKCENYLIKELNILKQVNDTQKNPPFTYNHQLQTGYFSTPSARMCPEGTLGFGYSSFSPYQTYNVISQPFKRLQLSGSYRIFINKKDRILSSYGFGDFSDKGVNAKFCLLLPEEFNYKLPGISIGVDDFLGTKAFHSKYAIFTYLFPSLNMELSGGVSTGYLKGLFGGVIWNCDFKNAALTPLKLAIEYDPIDYKKDPHEQGRSFNSRLNMGVKYTLWEDLNLSYAYLKGKSNAFSFSYTHNLGSTKGFLLKLDDVLLYKTPVNTQATGHLRSEQRVSYDFLHSLDNQGFVLEKMETFQEEGKKVLRLIVSNKRYWKQRETKLRLQSLIANLTPSNIDKVYVVIEGFGLSCHNYVFKTEFFKKNNLGLYERNLLSPMEDLKKTSSLKKQLLYKKDKKILNLYLKPFLRTYFGSSRGKVKYACGLQGGFKGYLFNTVYYYSNFSYNVFSDLKTVNDVDRLNPSQIINVRSDAPKYYAVHHLRLNEAYLQKSWNFSKGYFSRIAIGHFEPAYGGIASELMYYPTQSPWAVGIEATMLKKRSYNGSGFVDKIRKLSGFKTGYEKYRAYQYFLDIYYDFKDFNLDFKVSAGQFLAKDKGIKTLICRYFPSGLRLSTWFTYTTKRDYVNGKRYHDYGISLSMPLDIFSSSSMRTRWHYGLSAWLRDVGARSQTGKTLYQIVDDERKY